MLAFPSRHGQTVRSAITNSRIMPLPEHKTKIVATIGPASEAPEMLERLIRAGMNVARLNFSHGDFSSHAGRIANIRAAERITGRRVAIMADLPGPKMRLGKIEPEPIRLHVGDTFTLTTEEIVGTAQRVSMSFAPLPRVVKPGDALFLNDGLVQMVVERVVGEDVVCKVTVGGELRSRKGLNLPGIDLGISAFTEHDRACLEFALQHGVDAVSQSFVETAADLQAVRAAAQALGRQPFLIAKIERAGALKHFDEILQAADGIMVARGDLGVEVPIAEIAITQKQLIAQANLAGKPVITATQMLESMVSSRLPTRAEAGRHRLRDAFRRLCDGALPGGSRGDAGEHRGGHRGAAAAGAVARPAGSVSGAQARERRGGHRGRGGARAGNGAVRGGVRADAERAHAADDLALQAGGVDRRREPRPGGLPGAGVFLRRATGPNSCWSNRLARFRR